MKMSNYRFWGNENAYVKPVTDEFYGIGSPQDLYDALSKTWCAETCAPRLRGNWSEDNYTLGQCSITAFLAQDIFGGKVCVMKRPGGYSYCFVTNIL